MRFNSLGKLYRPAELARFLRTVRHLRARQWVYGLRYRLLPIPVPARPLALGSRAPAFSAGPAPRGLPTCFDGDDTFTFLNVSRRFGDEWQPREAGRLWTYNLHYMGWLRELQEGQEAWMRRWIEGNPVAGRGTGWEAYPLSVRLSNWCVYFCEQGRTVPGDILASMGLQAAFLLRQLEFHLDGNHLLENLLALAHVCFYADASARTTVARVYRLLDQEVEAQILADGGHYELSPMYHALLLERMLHLLNAWPDPGFQPRTRALLVRRCRLMLAWLRALSPGGEIALFNDAAFGQASPTPALLAYGERIAGPLPPSTALTRLPESGYARGDAGPWTLVFDCGPLGPDHQLGHAHCDMLSFCLWHEGIPLVTHPGTPQYVAGPAREYCRSTRAHNTLELDGEEQAELWAAHRVGRRGYPLEASSSVDADGALRFAGSHDAYAHLPGAPRHRRELRLEAGGLTVRDTLSSRSRDTRGRIFLHFHPDCNLQGSGRRWIVRRGAAEFSVECDVELRTEEGWYSPEFGKTVSAPALFAETGPGTVEMLVRKVNS